VITDLRFPQANLTSPSRITRPLPFFRPGKSLPGRLDYSGTLTTPAPSPKRQPAPAALSRARGFGGLAKALQEPHGSNTPASKGPLSDHRLDFFAVDPESMVRGHPALDGRDGVRDPRRDLPSGAAIAVRGKTFGRVQDVADSCSLKTLRCGRSVSRKLRIWRTSRAGWPARDQVVRRRRSFPGPPLARCRLLRGRLLVTSPGPTSGPPHLFLRDPLLQVEGSDIPAYTQKTGQAVWLFPRIVHGRGRYSG
jgi:hypothetical protein